MEKGFMLANCSMVADNVVFYGVVGDRIEIQHDYYYVGDLVMYKEHQGGYGVAILCFYNGSPSLWGWGKVDLNKNDCRFKILGKAIRYEFITDDMLCDEGLRLEKVKELTIEELRSYVPFPFRLKD